MVISFFQKNVPKYGRGGISGCRTRGYETLGGTTMMEFEIRGPESTSGSIGPRNCQIKWME